MLDEVARLVAEALAAVPDALPVGLTVAVPGLVRSGDGVVTDAPNLGWRDVPVLAGLAARLDPGCPVRAENDANLSADDKKQRIAEIDAKLDALDKQAAALAKQ